MSVRDSLRESKKNKLDIQKTEEERAMTENAVSTKNLFLRTWVSYFLSFFLKDRGTIPSNIGMSLHVLSNMFVTRNSLSTVIEIIEWGNYVPMFAIGYITDKLRRRNIGARLSWSFLNRTYNINKKDGLDERIKAWEKSVAPDSKYPRSERERASRQLYTVELWKQGIPIYYTKALVYIHGRNSAELDLADFVVKDELTKMGITFESKSFKVIDTLKESAMLSTMEVVNPRTILSNMHLSQLVPNFGGENDSKGVFIGMNKISLTPYRIDFKNISIARNMYIVAPSGVGKTVLAMNIVQSAFEQGSRVCLMDIKGNEYRSFIDSVGGVVVGLRINSGMYINSWALHKEDVTQDTAEQYFKERLQFTKQQVLTLASLTNREDVLNLESILDEFLLDYYMQMGVSMYNIHSWDASESLTPFDMWEQFELYYPAKQDQYHLPRSVITTLRMYFTRDGSKSFIFKDDFNYKEIMDACAISFDFGLLSSGATSSVVDMDILKLKFVYMSKINSDYNHNNYSHGIRTLKVLEESQIVSDDILHIYAQEYTLRRSQLQDTLLIGNSVAALQSAITAKPIIESTTCLFVSKLTKDALEFLIQQFGLEMYRPLLKLPGSESQYEHCFAIINNMQSSGVKGLVSVVIPTDEKTGLPKVYKVNVPTKEVVV